MLNNWHIRLGISLAISALSLQLSAQTLTVQSSTDPSQQITAPDYSAYILTPKAPDTPRINGPKVYGARPKADFIYRIPTTGVRPITFSATGLPKGLKLDKEKGIITGKVKKAGTYHVTLKAENALGSYEKEELLGQERF